MRLDLQKNEPDVNGIKLSSTKMNMKIFLRQRFTTFYHTHQNLTKLPPGSAPGISLCLPLPEIFFWKHLGGL
jgi:hypothetical protein